MCDLKDLVPVYEKVKAVILFSEYEGEFKIPLGPINELRNCLDHIMRLVSERDGVHKDHEFIEAKAHLYRAGNDVYEIVIMYKLDQFNDLKKELNIFAIKEIYPEYFTTLLPLIKECQEGLALTRSEKPIITEEEQSFGKYETISTKLSDGIDNFQKHTVGILNYQEGLVEKEKAEKKRTIKSRIYDFLVGGVIVGIILLIIQKAYFS